MCWQTDSCPVADRQIGFGDCCVFVCIDELIVSEFVCVSFDDRRDCV
jgi:hypothetical protein